jgi:ATP-binding protein involved in chromosome partitioning
MLGLDGRPDVVGETMIPLQAWGVTCMSMGFLVPERQAMIWRGPMVMGALEQMMGQVRWPELDVMVVDMPPGTGDAQLTMAQRVDLAGAVIVSTPQDIALIDARRGIDMFGKTGVPILGLVENMSVFCCPNCGHRTAIFGEGGVAREAERLGVTLLGAVPLLPAIRSAGDLGAPAEAGSEAGTAFDGICREVMAAIRRRGSALRPAGAGGPGPALH